jgi:hypothetical protein
MSESVRINRWLYVTLSEDATLIAQGIKGVRDYIPEQAEFPRIVYNLQAGRDVNGIGGVRLLTRPLYQIKLINKGNIESNYLPLIERMDELLHNKTNETFEGYVFSARREQEINYFEPGEKGTDIVYRHVGGLYRIDCYAI